MKILKSGKIKFSKDDEGKTFDFAFGKLKWNHPGFEAYRNGKRITSSFGSAFWTEDGEYHKGYKLPIKIKFASFEKWDAFQKLFYKVG